MGLGDERFVVVLWQKVVAYMPTYTLPERSCLQRQRSVHCYSRGDLLTSTESKKALTSFEDAKSSFEPPKKVLKKIWSAHQCHRLPLLRSEH